MNREGALTLLKEHLKNDGLVKHCIAVGAIMKGLAENLKENPDEWELAGILHDIDLEKCEKDYSNHGLLSAIIVEGKVSDKVKNAIKCHAFDLNKTTPAENIDFALIAADAISGLIVANALMQPNKKLSEVTVESIAKKYGKKDFAKNCNREHMKYCEKLGIEINKFFEIALKAEQRVSNELGL